MLLMLDGQPNGLEHIIDWCDKAITALLQSVVINEVLHSFAFVEKSIQDILQRQAWEFCQ